MSVAAIFAALGTGLSVVGGLAEGAAAERAANFNAAAREQQAASERDAARAEARDFRRAEGRSLAGARAARMGSGVQMGGSPLLVDSATVREIALGSGRIMHGGEVRSTRLRTEAELFRMQGRNARVASYFNAGSSLLSGASSWFGKYA